MSSERPSKSLGLFPNIILDDLESLQSLHKLFWGKPIHEFVTEEVIDIPQPPVKHPAPDFLPTLEPTKLKFKFLKTEGLPLPIDVLSNLPECNGPTPALLVRDEYEELFNEIYCVRTKPHTYIITGQAGIGMLLSSLLDSDFMED
ncbi:hypothetical protein FA15DRAFT_669883 [Coprinopsis marcescibilis]|uniref:Uncharacterized protein n=1 Tax=Coprinopsis marcescibilis TaxID=230819 RepID=A0A5C3KUD6_COPMA|nr:hypothetical protein FA15DRAFT_669883 [Coprinopsis marcescibilis]